MEGVTGMKKLIGIVALLMAALCLLVAIVRAVDDMWLYCGIDIAYVLSLFMSLTII